MQLVRWVLDGSPERGDRRARQARRRHHRERLPLRRDRRRRRASPPPSSSPTPPRRWLPRERDRPAQGLLLALAATELHGADRDQRGSRHPASLGRRGVRRRRRPHLRVDRGDPRARLHPPARRRVPSLAGVPDGVRGGRSAARALGDDGARQSRDRRDAARPPGGSVFFGPDTWHHAFAQGDEPLQVLEFLAPPPASGSTGAYARTRPYLEHAVYEREDGSNAPDTLRSLRDDESSGTRDLGVRSGTLAETPQLSVQKVEIESGRGVRGARAHGRRAALRPRGDALGPGTPRGRDLRVRARPETTHACFRPGASTNTATTAP